MNGHTRYYIALLALSAATACGGSSSQDSGGYIVTSGGADGSSLAGTGSPSSSGSGGAPEAAGGREPSGGQGGAAPCLLVTFPCMPLVTGGTGGEPTTGGGQTSAGGGGQASVPTAGSPGLPAGGTGGQASGGAGGAKASGGSGGSAPSCDGWAIWMCGTCGDGYCQVNETSKSCPQDCSYVTGVISTGSPYDPQQCVWASPTPMPGYNLYASNISPFVYRTNAREEEAAVTYRACLCEDQSKWTGMNNVQIPPGVCSLCPRNPAFCHDACQGTPADPPACTGH